MRQTTLIVPGFRGSGEAHWQTWFEQQLPDVKRVSGIDWEQPRLADWSAAVVQEIDSSNHPVWLIAHSFGCLATVSAAAERADKVLGALLVAPADPWRFVKSGLREWLPSTAQHDTIDHDLPQTALGFNSVVVASSNDPWVKITVAGYWAQRWGSHFVSIGEAGHINVDSGFGPWPQGLTLFQKMQAAQEDVPLGDIGVERCVCSSHEHRFNKRLQSKQDKEWRDALRQMS